MIRDLSALPIIENSLPLLHSALEIKGRWQTSFWDALIIAAAKESGAATLFSEDLNHDQNYGGTVVRNPFMTANP